MNESTFTFRVDESLKNEFAQAAKAQDRTGAQLLRDFMRDVVRRQREIASHEGAPATESDGRGFSKYGRLDVSSQG